MAESDIEIANSNSDLSVKTRVRKPSLTYQLFEKTTVDLLSSFDLWEEAKLRWLNIVQTSDTIQEEGGNPMYLAFKFFSCQENLKTPLHSSKLNEFFIQHLLSIHERFCLDCFASNKICQSESGYVEKQVNDERDETSRSDSESKCLVPDKTRKAGLRRSTLENTTQTDELELSLLCDLPSKNLTTGGASKTAIKLKKANTTQKRKAKTKDSSIKISKTPLRSSLKQSKRNVSNEDIDSNDSDHGSDEIEPQKSNSKDDDYDLLERVPFDIKELSEPSDKSESDEESDSDYSLPANDNHESPPESDAEAENSKKKFHVKRKGLRQSSDTEFDKKAFACELCGKEYKAPSTLRIHMLMHNGSLVDCPECGKKFKSTFSMNLHQARVHETKKDIYPCLVCGKEFQTKSILKGHQIVHREEKDFVCDICGKGFKRKYYLKEHRGVHTGESCHKCNLCDATFKHKSLVYRHKKEKHGSRDQLCKVCGKSYFTSAQLKRHELTHSEEPYYKCRECGKGYRSESGLESHMNTHKDTSPNVCHFCGKSFISRSNMYKHLARHQGIKPHTCVCCDKGFVTKQELTAHMKSHDDKLDSRVRRSKPKQVLNTEHERSKQSQPGPSGTCVYGYSGHSNFSGGSSIAMAGTSGSGAISTNDNPRESVPVINYGQSLFPGCDDYRYY